MKFAGWPARPYRPAFSEAEAMTMLRVGAGQQFDVGAVQALPQALCTLASAVEGEAAG